MSMTLGEASELVGVSRALLLRAEKRGEFADARAARDDATVRAWFRDTPDRWADRRFTGERQIWNALRKELGYQPLTRVFELMIRERYIAQAIALPATFPMLVDEYRVLETIAAPNRHETETHNASGETA